MSNHSNTDLASEPTIFAGLDGWASSSGAHDGPLRGVLKEPHPYSLLAWPGLDVAWLISKPSMSLSKKYFYRHINVT